MRKTSTRATAQAETQSPQNTPATPYRVHQVSSSAGILMHFWDKCAHNLTPEDLAFFSTASEVAKVSANNLHKSVEGVASLIASDIESGALQNAHDLPAYLFTMSESFAHIGALLEIGQAADFQLANPEYFGSAK
jgi:hypothetical protein